jgi:hypothetical protein
MALGGNQRSSLRRGNRRVLGLGGARCPDPGAARFAPAAEMALQCGVVSIEGACHVEIDPHLAKGRHRARRTLFAGHPGGEPRLRLRHGGARRQWPAGRARRCRGPDAPGPRKRQGRRRGGRRPHERRHEDHRLHHRHGELRGDERGLQELFPVRAAGAGDGPGRSRQQRLSRRDRGLRGGRLTPREEGQPADAPAGCPAPLRTMPRPSGR